MSLVYEAALDSEFEMITKAFFLKQPDCSLRVKDVFPVSVEFDGPDKLRIRRVKSLLNREKWSEEEFEIDRSDRSLKLNEKGLGVDVDLGEETLMIRAGRYIKEARVKQSKMWYNTVSWMGLKHLKGIDKNLKDGKISFMTYNLI